MSDIDEVARAIGRLEGKADALHDTMTKSIESTQKVHKEHGRRLSSLERSRSRALGVLSTISVLFGTGAGFLVSWLKGGS